MLGISIQIITSPAGDRLVVAFGCGRAIMVPHIDDGEQAGWRGSAWFWRSAWAPTYAAANAPRRRCGRCATHSGTIRSAAPTSSDGKSVVEGKSVAVRVDLGGRGNIKKKKQNKR